MREATGCERALLVSRRQGDTVARRRGESMGPVPCSGLDQTSRSRRANPVPPLRGQSSHGGAAMRGAAARLDSCGKGGNRSAIEVARACRVVGASRGARPVARSTSAGPEARAAAEGEVRSEATA